MTMLTILSRAVTLFDNSTAEVLPLPIVNHKVETLCETTVYLSHD